MVLKPIRLEEFSKTKGIPMSQLALAWVMNKDREFMYLTCDDSDRLIHL